MPSLVPALLAALCVVTVPPTQCAETHQPATAGLHITPDELWQLIDRAVAAATQPLTIKLDSRIDTLDTRLHTLDSRLYGLDSRVDELAEHRRNHDAELASVNAELDNHTLQLEETTKQLDYQKTQLQGHESRLDVQESRLDEQAARLTEHNSEMAGQASRIDTQKSRLDNHTAEIATHDAQLDAHSSKIDDQQSQLDELLNKTESQQARIDGSTLRLIGLQTRSSRRDCSDLPAGSRSGVYLLQPGLDGTERVSAYCDMEMDGGGWTVIQRRDDIKPREDFYLDWSDYKEGFGDLDKEFWWGLENVWTMTSSRDRLYELRTDLEDFEGQKRYAIYKRFQISPESDNYRLTVANYTGDAGDALTYHNGMSFSTKDRDNDKSVGNCAQGHKGGWWYNACHHASLNGLYLAGPDTTFGVGVKWKQWRGYRYSLKKTTMKIRPTRKCLNE